MKAATSVSALALAALVGYLIGTSPPGVSPPHVPGGFSPLSEVPPWPIFRVAVGLNDLLRGAAEATTLPKVRIIDLATARFHSQVLHILTKSDVFDAVHDTPLSCAATATKLVLHEAFLCRLMKAGVSLGLLSEGADGTFGTTPTSSLLLRGVPASQKSFVEMINNPYWVCPVAAPACQLTALVSLLPAASCSASPADYGLLLTPAASTPRGTPSAPRRSRAALAASTRRTAAASGSTPRSARKLRSSSQAWRNGCDGDG